VQKFEVAERNVRGTMDVSTGVFEVNYLSRTMPITGAKHCQNMCRISYYRFCWSE
jgi:hypothetical protein